MERSCGVLLPISALPSRYGIGTLGRAAFRFVDFLKKAGHTYWQLLPTVPSGVGNSPYSSFSTFAGNPYFIDPDELIRRGLLKPEECEGVAWSASEDRVDYQALNENRMALLRRAYARSQAADDPEFARFRRENASWLGDYSFFMALKDWFGGKSWREWDDPLRLRQPEALAQYREKLADDIGFWNYTQYLFSRQYRRLKAYARGSGIRIVGDMPIYVAEDSADIWAHPQLFSLDADLRPRLVAGVPPDYFSRTGQLWGNPVYDWQGHRQALYDWWLSRFESAFALFDVIRIDHFRAFDEYYAIPYGEATAEHGSWEKGPGNNFFESVRKRFSDPTIIAEDLGGITASVRQLLKDTGFPGMKVLQFGFNAADDSMDLPHHYLPNQVAYTGTHDNDTLVGWFEKANDSDQRFAMEYLNIRREEDFPSAAIHALFCSPANLAVVPMQDWLELPGGARMNTPSTIGDNWEWRLRADQLTDALAERMNGMATVSRRNSLWKEDKTIDPAAILQAAEDALCEEYHTTLAQADTVPVYRCLSRAVVNAVYPLWRQTETRAETHKQACYLSAEFLVGRLVYNNLYALGLLEDIRKLLGEKGFDICRLEDIEDAALGNGGLGRLAACFLDSAATHRLPLRGYGIRYRYGLFRQSFENGFQTERADDWDAAHDPWSVRREDEKLPVRFADQTVWAVPYDMPVIGYRAGFVGTLRLWQSEPRQDFDFSLFNAQKYDAAVREKNDAERISMVLYPNDDTDAGKALRIKQEYFLTSASMQDMLRRFKASHGADFDRIPDFYVCQLNDTHPVMAIPELVRLLTAEGLDFPAAFAIARRTFAYTNHTVMAEALEKWNYRLFKSVVPEIAAVIRQINRCLLSELHRRHASLEEIERRAIVADGNVHIARLAVYSTFAVNGVARIHTEILKHRLFADWYADHPEKFQNKTNGITQRRWLGLCNPELAGLITGLIGDSWLSDLSALQNLTLYRDDEEVLRRFAAVKLCKKRQLADYIRIHEQVDLDPDFIFDIQAKRLHEYKRQLLNAFSIVSLYFQLREGRLPDFQPTAYIFGAKAAPGYLRAKGIIKYINEIARVVNGDPRVADKLKVVFVQNYDVSYAEKLMPAADISEQISTAGLEASGTGNMKFMLGGAVTLGTHDGANIEIFEYAGEANNYGFGATVEELDSIRDTYDPKKLYETQPELRRAVDTLVDGTFDDGGTGWFRELYQSLLEGASWHRPDNYFLFYDFADYMKRKLQANADYRDRAAFVRKCWENVAHAGPFSSDRTVAEYAADIWHIREQ